MKGVAILSMLGLLFCAQLSIAAEKHALSDKTQYEPILGALIEAYGDEFYKRPPVYNVRDAEEVLNKAIFLAFLTDQGDIQKFNQPLSGMDIGTDLYFVPEKKVEEALCRFFGFSPENEKDLQEAINSSHSRYGDIFTLDMGSGGDTTGLNCQIATITHMKNGLARMEGSWGNKTFKAYFEPSGCGGRTRWVPIKIIFNDVPEEADDYRK